MGATVDGSIVGIAIAEEQSLRVLPQAATWRRFLVNTFPDFGPDVTTVARDTINPTRQVQRGTITGVTAKGGMNIDLTQNNQTDLAQGFFFASYTRPFDAVKDAGPTAPIPDGIQFNTAAPYTAGLVKVGSLIAGTKYANAGNNALKVVTAVGASTITAAGTVAEAAPPNGANVTVVGYEAGALALTVSGGLITLVTTTDDFTTLGLQLGQWIFVGGDLAVNQFATNRPGMARVSAITTTQLTFDLTFFAVTAEATTAGKKIRLFFGRHLQNASTPSAIHRRTYTIERTLGLDSNGAPQAEYLLGAVPNEMTINLPLKNKATVDFDFVAMDGTTRSSLTTPSALLSVGGTFVDDPAEAPFNTSSDLSVIRIAVVDPTTLNPGPLFAFATDAKITINNGVTPDDALTVIGAIEASVSDFTVTGTATAYFNSVAGIAAIRANAPGCVQAMIAKQNAGQVYDIPLITLGGGRNKVEKGKPITIDLTQAAAQGPNGYTMAVNYFTYLPNSAMPVTSA